MAENGVESAGGEPGAVDPSMSQKKLIEKIRAHESYAAKVKGAYSELSTMYNQLRDDYATFVTKHNETTKKFEDARKEQDEKIIDLETAIEELKNDMDQKVSERESDLSSVRKDLEHANEYNLELMKASEESEKLRDELEESNAERDRLAEQNGDLEKDLQLAKEELTRLKQEMGTTLGREEVPEEPEPDPEPLEGEDDMGAEAVESEPEDEQGPDLAALVAQVEELWKELREQHSELASSQRKLEAVVEIDSLSLSENPDDLLQELVRVKTELAEVETTRLRMQQEMSNLRKMTRT